MRANSKWYKHTGGRFDCAIVSMDSNELACVRVLAFYRVTLPSGCTEDIVLVRWFKRSTWKPKTNWKGCRVFEEGKASAFIFAKYLVRAAHLIPTFEMRGDTRRFYFNDVIDSDMYLRVLGCD